MSYEKPIRHQLEDHFAFGNWPSKYWYVTFKDLFSELLVLSSDVDDIINPGWDAFEYAPVTPRTKDLLIVVRRRL